MNPHMLTTIVRETFLKEVGKFQSRVQNGTPKGMLLRFRSYPRTGEEGYRTRELLVYASLNYVGVYERDTWNVIAADLLEYDEKTDEDQIKKGHDYDKGASPWILRAFHDSCWTDAIDTFLKTYEKEIDGFSGSNWFTVVPVEDYVLPDQRP
jgi:hypothetical protein